MSLEQIVSCYLQGNLAEHLAEHSDLALDQASTKVTTWQQWRQRHPTASPSDLPNADCLSQIITSIDTLRNRRYGCND